MERRQLEELIRLLMKENDRLYIPGFGVIQKHMQSAQFDKIHNRLLPPSYEFKLEDHLHYDDPYLAEMFAWYTDTEPSKAEQFVVHFGEKLYRDLYTRGKSEIQGVAAFQKSGETVATISDPSFSKTNRLPVLDVQDIWEEDVTRQQVWWEFSVFGVMLLLVLGFVYFLLYTGTSGPAYLPAGENPPTIGNQLTLPEIPENDTISYPQLELLPDGEDLQLVETPPQVDPPRSGRLPVIIVGAFEHSNNVRKMRQLLEKRGWKVYEEPMDSHSMTRIGFTLDRQEDIDSVLGLVRREIEPDAWVLVQSNNKRRND
ncbi:MAG: hypothetical protein R2806_19460 [Saprospiraceae bacterium]